MKLLKFEGFSDDTFACEGPGIDVDRDNGGNGEPVHMLVEASDGALIVTGQYGAGQSSGWLIGVAPPPDDDTSNDRPIPPWTITIARGRAPYSPALVISAPNDVTVSLLENDEN